MEKDKWGWFVNIYSSILFVSIIYLSLTFLSFCYKVRCIKILLQYHFTYSPHNLHYSTECRNIIWRHNSEVILKLPRLKFIILTNCELLHRTFIPLHPNQQTNLHSEQWTNPPKREQIFLFFSLFLVNPNDDQTSLSLPVTASLCSPTLLSNYSHLPCYFIQLTNTRNYTLSDFKLLYLLLSQLSHSKISPGGLMDIGFDLFLSLCFSI